MCYPKYFIACIKGKFHNDAPYSFEVSHLKALQKFTGSSYANLKIMGFAFDSLNSPLRE